MTTLCTVETDGLEILWAQFLDQPTESIVRDIHCVTKRSKLETRWRGVSLDALLKNAGPLGTFATVWCDGGYTTNLPLAELTGGKARVAYEYENAPLAAEHGGPARLLVPHLYF